MAWKKPLIIILGATGTGKTKLSLELAQRFKSEIISADSMQVYLLIDFIYKQLYSQMLILVIQRIRYNNC